MKFGIIGAGEVSLAIARALVSQGHEVALSSRRGPAQIGDKVAALGVRAEAVPVQEAATADIVFLAVPWEEVKRALADLPPWNGRILIDATNPFIRASSKYVAADLGGRSSSAIVADHAPEARVVKAFNSILMKNFEEGPTQGGVRRVLFVSGDDDAAKDQVRGLIEALGYAVIDLGGLEDGGRMQQGDGPLAGKDLLLSADWRLNG
jgi:8-hydroxy-5-deazaflavin:NADPH oxidoreductase